MGDLYRIVDYESLVEGQQILGYGNHVLRWNFDLMGTPRYGIVPDDEVEKELESLKTELDRLRGVVKNSSDKLLEAMGVESDWDAATLMLNASVRINRLQAENARLEDRLMLCLYAARGLSVGIHPNDYPEVIQDIVNLRTENVRLREENARLQAAFIFESAFNAPEPPEAQDG